MCGFRENEVYSIKMNINEFVELGIEKAICYDFKDEFSIEFKEVISKRKGFLELEDIEKWLVYKSSNIEVDCDVSELAVNIYRNAWHYIGNQGYKVRKQSNRTEKYELAIENGNRTVAFIRGDTMNSFFTPLKSYLYLNKVSSECVKPERLLEEYNQISAKIDTDLKLFARLTHTVGNFLPVPVVFNLGRVEETSDYWDLTLLGIYNYYSQSKRNIELSIILSEVKERKTEKIIFSYEVIERYCIDWLSYFETWNEFVKANYLQDFVSGNEEIGFGKPIMFWDKHSFEKKDPACKEDISQYLRKVNFMILERGRRILKTLNKQGSKKIID